MKKAKEQLISTYKHYKERNIINSKQKCYLVVSFPLCEIPFQNFAQTQDDVKQMNLKKVAFWEAKELKIKNEFILEI
jgi:hypothetical protein